MTPFFSLFAGLKIWKVFVVSFLVVALALTVKWAYDQYTGRNAAEQRAKVLMVVNDSTNARAALISAQFNELKALKDAAKTMGGKLVAGVEIIVKPETVHVAVRPVPTTNLPDSTRTATVTDTTEGYAVTVDAVAPPYPAQLQLGYTLTTPEFRPQVGFVKRDEGYYAVVSWGGRTFTPEHAFYSPEAARRFGLYVGAQMLGDPLANLNSQPLTGNGYIAAKYMTSKQTYALLAGFNGKPFLGIGIERKIW